MSCFQRKDGRWVVKHKDSNGKWVQTTFRDRKEAFDFDDELYKDSRQGSRLTVFEAVMLHVKDHDFSQPVNDRYSWIVCGRKGKKVESIGPAQCIADKYVDELTRRDLNEVRDNMRARNVKNVTINITVSKLKAAFNYAVQEGLVKANPWAGLRPLPERHGSRQGRLEDFHKVYAVLPEWMRWASRTALALCLRPGLVELFRLQWSAFDFARGAVTVWMGKVGRSKTVYPIKEYMDEAKARFDVCGNRDAYVCLGPKGQTVMEYRYAWRNACIKAGVRMPMYALRHISATQMIAAGADVAAVAANLGHSTPNTTLRAYAHALPQGQRAASAAIGAVWCGSETKKAIESGS